MVDGEEEKVAPAGQTTNNGNGGDDGDKDARREKKVNFHDGVTDVHKTKPNMAALKDSRREKRGDGRAAKKTP